MSEDVTRSISATDAAADSQGPLPDTLISSPHSASPPPPTPPVLPMVPGYEVLGELGRGAMGVVYKARNLALGRIVALKMILAGAFAGPEEVERLRKEAEALGRMQHPNVVQVFEVGEIAGRPFFALEYVEGGALDRKLAGAPQPPKEAPALVETLARAVHAAHRKQIVHRDLKPANVLLTADGTPKITDFGLAKRLDEEGRTASGAVMGTPSYMAPEQARGRSSEVGPAADVYALGAVLYQMLTGRPPFRADTPLNTMLQVLTLDPTPPRQLRPDLPRDLETICLTCLHKEPRRRYATALALADDLRRFLDRRPITVRRVGAVERLALWAQRRPAAAAAVGLLALAMALGAGGGAAVWFWHRAEEARGQAVGALGQAETEKARAETARGEAVAAEQAEKKAREDLAKVSCLRQVDLAYHDWQAGRWPPAEKLLDECPAELRGWEWRHVKRLCHPELTVWKPSDGYVLAAAFSPDGQRLAVAQKGAVRLYDADTGRADRVLDPLPGLRGENIERVAFTADGGRVVGADTTRCGVWDVDTGRLVGGWDRDRGDACASALSPDGRRLAVLSSARSDPNRPVGPPDAFDDDYEYWIQNLQLWDAAQGGKAPLAVARTEGLALDTLVFSPDGKRLAGRGPTGVTRFWDAETGADWGKPINRPGEAECVAFDPAGKLAAVGDDHRDIRVLDAETGEERATLRGHAGDVTRVAFSPDGTRLASASSYDATVRLWDVKAGREVRVLGVHARVGDLLFRPDGKRVVSFGENDMVKVWDATADEETPGATNGARVFAGRDPATKDIRCVAFRPDGGLLAGGTRDGTVRLWDVVTGQAARPSGFDTGFHGWVTGVAFRPDGKRLAAASNTSGVRMWDAATGRPVVSIDWRQAFGVTDLAYSPDGGRLVASMMGKVQEWDADTGRLMHSLTGADGGDGRPEDFMSAAFSPDGKRVAAGAYGKVHVWDAETGEELRVLHGQDATSPSYAAYSSDGRFLAASDGSIVRVWEAESGRDVYSLNGHSSTVEAVAFSPDGKRLASGGADWTVRLWDLESGREALTLSGPAGTVWRVAFSRDGDRLASASEDGTVHLWDARPLPKGP